MRLTLTACALVLTSGLSHAGLFDDLREMRGAISEVSQTAKEASAAAKELSGATGQSNASGNSQSTGGALKNGDTMVGKIGNTKVYKEPSKKSTVVATLGKNEEMIYTGTDANGFYSVASSNGEGWVDKVLVKKQ